MEERNVYTTDSLERLLAWLEARYELSSAEFYERHLADEVPVTIPRWHRHVWASFYREVRAMRGDDFVERAARSLELV